MYLVGFDCLETLEQFSILCEDEKEMQELIRLTANVPEVKVMSMTAMPLTVKAKEYIEQLKKLNKPDDLFFGRHEEIKEDDDD